ncbi:MAG: PD40 domain-containing protein [Armatimonadetes bacterium]|nr:PD40 domain-containing protein [Armatimonadota bacterium]
MGQLNHRPTRLLPLLIFVGLAGITLCWGGMWILPMIGFGGKSTDHNAVTFNVDPTGKSIIFSSADEHLYLLDLGTSVVSAINTPSGSAVDASFAPDGDTIVYATPNPSNGFDLETLNLRSRAVKHLTTGTSTSDSQPCFSPDGRSVAFVRAHRYRAYSMGGMVWDDYDIYLLDLESGTAKRLTDEKYYAAGSPSFSDHGKSITYSCSRHDLNVGTGINKISISSGSRPITVMPGTQDGYRGGAFASEAQISPDGTKMTFISDRAKPYEYDVYIADTDGSNPHRLELTKVSSYNQSPRFSADGQAVYVLAGMNQVSLYWIDFDGHTREVADSEMFSSPKTWKGPSSP